MITERTTCRACGGAFDALLDLGRPVLSTFLAPHEKDPKRAPLELVVCQQCQLVQLRHMVDRDRLFGTTYWYHSSVNEVMRAELTHVAHCAIAMVDGIGSSDVVLDVGANDGTGLAAYASINPRLHRIAVEPAAALIPSLTPHAHQVLHGFFPDVTHGMVARSVKILSSIAMFYDVNDPKAFVAEVDRLLTDRGVWIVQMQDLGQMVRATAFDNVCNEHAVTYSLATFRMLLDGFNLAITKVEPRAINGGSLRIFVQRKGLATDPLSIYKAEQMETWLTRDALDRFAWRVCEYKAQLRGIVEHLHSQGHEIDLYAASTKSSTLLQYCEINHRLIRYAVERTPEKVGLVTSGTRIPIVSEETWRSDPAPVTLIGAWPFTKAFCKREAAYLEAGGSFLAPLPHVEVICGAKA